MKKLLSIVWFVPGWAKVQHATYGLKGEKTVCGQNTVYDLENGKIPAKHRNKKRLTKYPACKRCTKGLMKHHGTLTGRVKVEV